MEYPLTFEQYQQGLSEGKLLGLRCQSCETYTVPPQGVCRICQGQNLLPVEVKGRGIIRTFTVIRVAPEGKQPPYVLVLVELEQGPWVMGLLGDVDPEKADLGLIGKSVRLGPPPVNGSLSPAEVQVPEFNLIAAGAGWHRFPESPSPPDR
jgi:uncharacterized protein